MEKQRWFPTGALCQRFGVCDRTIKRWRDQGILPPPLKINRRNYNSEEDIASLERAREASKPPPINMVTTAEINGPQPRRRGRPRKSGEQPAA